jgi:hypothetical protein
MGLLLTVVEQRLDLPPHNPSLTVCRVGNWRLVSHKRDRHFIPQLDAKTVTFCQKKLLVN